MTDMDPRDPNEIPGRALGAQTEEEGVSRIKQGLRFPSDPIRQEQATTDRAFSSTLHVTEAPKYPFIQPMRHAYFGRGVLSLDMIDGTMVLSKGTRARTSPIFRTSGKSTLYSSASNTVLGSLNIKTLGGHVQNPLTSALPSSPFSPVTTWMKNLFPVLPLDSILTIAVLELIQEALLELITDKDREASPKTQTLDLGTIIIDNQEVEERLFNEQFG